MTTTETTTTGDRPDTLDDLIGQAEVVARMRIVFAGAKARDVKPPHVLLSGPAGHGKTTLARIVAREMGAEIVTTTGPTLRRAGDLAGLLCAAEDGSVIFIDEIHRLPAVVEEALYEALEDGTLSIMVGAGAAARAVTLNLPSVVVVGATTKPGALSTPLRDRFGVHFTMAPYGDEELTQIVARAWERAGADFTEAAARAVGERSKGVPRLALHLAQRVLDVAAIDGEPVHERLALRALAAFGVGDNGLDETDWRVIEVLVAAARPLGLASLAQACDLDPTTIENDHEGPLVRTGIIVRSPQGRMATPLAHELLRARS